MPDRETEYDLLNVVVKKKVTVEVRLYPAGDGSKVHPSAYLVEDEMMFTRALNYLAARTIEMEYEEG